MIARIPTCGKYLPLAGHMVHIRGRFLLEYFSRDTFSMGAQFEGLRCHWGTTIWFSVIWKSKKERKHVTRSEHSSDMADRGRYKMYTYVLAML